MWWNIRELKCLFVPSLNIPRTVRKKERVRYSRYYYCLIQSNQQREHQYHSALTHALIYSDCSSELHCHACTHSRSRSIWQGLQTLMIPFHGMKKITEGAADIKLTATRHICDWVAENGLAWLSTLQRSVWTSCWQNMAALSVSVCSEEQHIHRPALGLAGERMQLSLH